MLVLRPTEYTCVRRGWCVKLGPEVPVYVSLLHDIQQLAACCTLVTKLSMPCQWPMLLGDPVAC
jgi:hypothetical protein